MSGAQKRAEHSVNKWRSEKWELNYVRGGRSASAIYKRNRARAERRVSRILERQDD